MGQKPYSGKVRNLFNSCAGRGAILRGAKSQVSCRFDFALRRLFKALTSRVASRYITSAFNNIARDNNADSSIRQSHGRNLGQNENAGTKGLHWLYHSPPTEPGDKRPHARPILHLSYGFAGRLCATHRASKYKGCTRISENQ